MRLLDAHPDVAVTSEIGWLASRYEKRLSLTADGLVAPGLIDELLEDETLGRYTPFPLSREDAVLATREPISYADFVARLFDRYGELRGKQLVGNKTVILVRSIATLHELWPHAKFVHLIRDGRDVALSAIGWRRIEKLVRDFPIWREDPVSAAAAWWEWHLRPALGDGSALGAELYHEIRYESLVTRPADEMRRVCAFLGIAYDEALLRFHEGRTRAESGLDAKHAWLPPTPGLRDWRRDMSCDEVERFEAVAGDLLSELGYPRRAPFPTLERLEHAARVRRAFEEHAHTYLATHEGRRVAERAARAAQPARLGVGSGER
jgi:hypothetical protein